MPRTSTSRPRPLRAFWGACLCLSVLAAPLHAAKEPKKRVAITAFENEAKSSVLDLGGIGGGMAEKLAAVLMETDKFVVLERRALEDVLKEQNLKKKAPVNPIQAARLTSAQALIRGVITDVEAIGKPSRPAPSAGSPAASKGPPP